MKRKKWYLIMVIALALLGGAFFGYQYFIHHYRLSEDDQVVKNLEERIVVPEGIPTVATVTDTKELGDHPFFARAAVGDKVIIYTAGARGYLFRPSTNKIIDITTIQTGKPAEPVLLRLPDSKN